MPERVIAIVQARLGSQRYPRKILEDIDGLPMIAHVVERVASCAAVGECIVACPWSDRDDILAALRSRTGFQMCAYAGADADVLARFCHAAKNHPAEFYMRVTSDCPLWAPDIGRQVADETRGPEYAFTTNVTGGYVDGTDVEVIRRDALMHAGRAAVLASDREHVTPFVKRNNDHYVVAPPGEHSRHKWSVDTPDDLDRVRRIMKHVRGLNFADTLAAAVEAGV